MYQQKEVLEIFLSAVESVLPENLIKKNLLVRNGQLSYRDVCIHLADFEHIYLIGFGKASAQMARTMEELLGNWLTGGHILTKYNHSVELKNAPSQRLVIRFRTRMASKDRKKSESWQKRQQKKI